MIGTRALLWIAVPALAVTWLLAASRTGHAQPLGPAAPHGVCGVDCVSSGCRTEANWRARGPILWQKYAQGEYAGPARLQHIPEYRLRVDDLLELIYRVTRRRTTRPYELNVGDQIRIESLTDEQLLRDLIIQPDGTISLALLGQVPAAGKTVDQLRKYLDERYKKYYNDPAITVTPLKVNTKLEDLRATVDNRAGVGGQSVQARIVPDGTISIPSLDRVPAQGLTLPELKREINEMYSHDVQGIEVTPVLVQRAPRYVFVVGEVRAPGRFTMEGPTTLIQAIALAGGWNVGANLHQVVVFRRGEDWRLKATMLDIRGALYAKRPCPASEIWLSDSDIVVVPKSRILQTNEFIDQVFTRGIYGVFPFQGASLNFTKLGTL